MTITVRRVDNNATLLSQQIIPLQRASVQFINNIRKVVPPQLQSADWSPTDARMLILVPTAGAETAVLAMFSGPDYEVTQI